MPPRPKSSEANPKVLESDENTPSDISRIDSLKIWAFDEACSYWGTRIHLDPEVTFPISISIVLDTARDVFAFIVEDSENDKQNN